jgi:hypothetical protein
LTSVSSVVAPLDAADDPVVGLSELSPQAAIASADPSTAAIPPMRAFDVNNELPSCVA